MRRLIVVGTAIGLVLQTPGVSTSATAQQIAVDIDGIPGLLLVEELRIGSSSDPGIGFSRIGNVTVDREGRLYVFESQDAQIRVYDATGRPVRRIGRRGEGPGEFRQSARIGVRGDTIWAIEGLGLNSNVSLFRRSDGSVISTTTVDPVRVPGRGTSNLLISPSEMRGDGTFISGGYSISTTRDAPPTGLGPSDSLRIPRVVFSASGAVLDTLAWRVEPPTAPQPALQTLAVGGNRRNVPRPPPESELSSYFAEGRFAVMRPRPSTASPATFRVMRENLRGQQVYARSYRYTPVRYTSEVLDDIAAASLRSSAMVIVDGAIQQSAPDTTAASRAAIRQAMTFPDFQLPVQNTIVSADGSIWLRREEAKSPTQRWDLLDAQGNPRGRVNLPNNNRIAWHSGDIVWIVRPDADDVPWLVRTRITR
jgi:hypothetical protein